MLLSRVACQGRLQRILFGMILFALPLTVRSYAKTAGLTAIEIYPAGDGQSYAQLADFVLDGKNEVYLCGNASSFDKSAYHKLGKVGLSVGMTIERNDKGILMLSNGASTPVCVVPGNLKFESSGPKSAAELADKAQIEARVLPASDPVQAGAPPLKIGVKLVFVAAPDPEYAEYLRADRAATVLVWKSYLDKYESGAHAASGRKSLAALYLPAGEKDFKEYSDSKSGSDPNYAKLKEAREMADAARVLVPDDADAAGLTKKVHDEVIALSSQSSEKLELYKQALKQQTAGYVNLVAATKLADGAFSVEPKAHEAAGAKTQAAAAQDAFERTLHDTEGQIAARRPDQAAEKIALLKSFAAENPAIAQDLKAIATLYITHAKKNEESLDWPDAIKDLEKAATVTPNEEIDHLLVDARQQGKIAADKAAADAALAKSQTAETSDDFITAYEVLDDLPAEQRKLVAERIETLKESYIKAAEAAAKVEQKAHEPINGLSDEQGIQRAYQYLQRCYQITNDPALADRISSLGEDLSGYYLREGKHYAERPEGTGVNVAWTYLAEAQRFKSSTNLSAVHDEVATIRAAHLLRSRLSVKVEFREGTSRREAVEFAPQLTDAMATGLESMGSLVKVIRPQETSVVQPNFQLVGEVTRHDITRSEKKIGKTSRYFSGTAQGPNPEWNQADQEYETANNELQSARSKLTGAQARGKKKEIADAQGVVDANQKKVNELRMRLNSIPQTVSHDVDREYTYTQVDHHLQTVVELQFRIVDNSGNEVIPRKTAARDIPTDYSVKENVKSEDTAGVRNEGTVPNENNLLELAEYQARDELISKARDSVSELPAILLTQAERKVADGDTDAAAELYILYLNSTPVADTTERLRARKFLADGYNFKEIGKVAFTE